MTWRPSAAQRPTGCAPAKLRRLNSPPSIIVNFPCSIRRLADEWKAATRHNVVQEITNMLPIKKIVCPTDFSEPSLAALETACELAKHFDAELRILHVIPFTPPFPTDMVVVAAPSYYPSDSERIEEAHRQVANLIEHRVPREVRALPEVEMGHAANEIVCAAEDDGADIIVIGTHGASGWRHLAFGSVAEKVVRMAHRPVLTVHGGVRPDSTGQPETASANGLRQHR
jgi:nucleotide-binding universal stress UspA family protein